MAAAAAAALAAATEPGPLFRPFRALGYITDDVPFAVQRRGKEAFVTFSVGRTWQARRTARPARAAPRRRRSAAGRATQEA
jgi:hypothetical protein